MQLKGNTYLKLPKYLDLNMPNVYNSKYSKYQLGLEFASWFPLYIL